MTFYKWEQKQDIWSRISEQKRNEKDNKQSSVK